MLEILGGSGPHVTPPSLGSAGGQCKSSSGSFDECSTSTGQPPTFGPSRSARANSLDPPKLSDCIHHRHLLLLFIVLSLNAVTDSHRYPST